MAKEDKYNAYKFAKSLGFSDADARLMADAKLGKGADATTIRRIARVKGLLPAEGMARMRQPVVAEPVTIIEPQAEGKRHKHYYRKDDTCACGQVKKVKK